MWAAYDDQYPLQSTLCSVQIYFFIYVLGAATLLLEWAPFSVGNFKKRRLMKQTTIPGLAASLRVITDAYHLPLALSILDSSCPQLSSLLVSVAYLVTWPGSSSLKGRNSWWLCPSCTEIATLVHFWLKSGKCTPRGVQLSHLNAEHIPPCLCCITFSCQNGDSYFCLLVPGLQEHKELGLAAVACSSAEVLLCSLVKLCSLWRPVPSTLQSSLLGDNLSWISYISAPLASRQQ